MTPQKRKPRSRMPQEARPATIADVARLANVSAMTVSRVINREGRVRASTAETVQRAIAELNYAPNSAARTLAGASRKRIGLLYNNPSEAYLSAFLVGSLDQANRADVQLVVQKCDSDDSEMQIIERFINSGIDGVILPPPLCDSPVVQEMLIERNIPAVAVATAGAPKELGAVAIDDRGAARAMTSHLLGLGHERIGFIIGNPNLSASAERLAGYREALAAKNIAASDDVVVQGLFTYRSGLDAAERLLALENPPTAIFASNDDMAAATIAVAHKHGLDVPSDLSVVGFDDSALATTIWPELTTIRQPIAEMSRAAVELVSAMLRAKRSGEKEPPRRQMLDYALIRRQSDAVPRRRPLARI